MGHPSGPGLRLNHTRGVIFDNVRIEAITPGCLPAFGRHRLRRLCNQVAKAGVITFGYVYGVPSQDYLHSVSVNFIHYPDLGWIVSSIDK